MDTDDTLRPDGGAAPTEAASGGDGTRERLILAGLRELNEHGIRNFSTRRVAKTCGVSCAAPYKHFKDTHAFIAEILKYINGIYYERQKQTLARFTDRDSRCQLLEVSLDYIRFLAEHPEFRRIIMQNYRSGGDEEFQALRGSLSMPIYRLVARYCRDVNMSPEARRRKTFVFRSIIYGAAMFIDNGQMAYNEETMAMVASVLEREFDLP